MIATAVIPVAGLGTRLLPATKAQPKEMLAVGGKPVVQHVVEELAGAGVDHVVLITGRGKGAIENHFDPDPALVETLRVAGKEELLARLDFERLGIAITYVRQPLPLGLGDAVLRAAPVVGERPFLLALGDSILTASGNRRSLADRLSDAVHSGAECAVALELVDAGAGANYGIAAPREPPVAVPAGSEPVQPFELADLVEKPDPGSAPSRYAVAGRYAIGPAILAELRGLAPGHEDEIQLTDAIAALIAAGGRVIGVPLEPGERRLDTGTPLSYAAAFLELAIVDPEIGPELRERFGIPPR